MDKPDIKIENKLVISLLDSIKNFHIKYYIHFTLLDVFPCTVKVT